MTEVQKFLTAIAQWNGSDDIDDQPFSEGEVIKTHEPASAFGGSETKVAGLFYMANHQIMKGGRRGDLFLMDFGSFRLVATTAEGKI